MVDRFARRHDGVEVSPEFGRGDLPGDVIAPHVVIEEAVSQVDRRDGCNPCFEIVFDNDNFPEQVDWWLA